MIKFFRHKRYDLMGKNKTGKYLKYAIGEIVLVVIGILIALSINNWNEQRKEHNKEIKYLISLKADLLVDLGNLETIIAYCKTKTTSASMLLKYDKPNSIDEYVKIDSLRNSVNGWMQFKPRTNTVDELISSGNLNIISNDSIKTAMLGLKQLNKTIDTYVDHIRHEFDNYIYDRSAKILESFVLLDFDALSNQDKFVRNISLLSGKEDLIYNQVSMLLNDLEFRNGLKLAARNFYFMRKAFENLKQNSEILIELINTDINLK